MKTIRIIKLIKFFLYGSLAFFIYFEFNIDEVVTSTSRDIGISRDAFLSGFDEVNLATIQLSSNIIWTTITLAVIEAVQNLIEAIVWKGKSE